MEEEKYKCHVCNKEFKDRDTLNLDYESKEREWICSDCQHNRFMERYEIITDRHNNEDTALIVDNYPYGFRLRTKIRYWIETTKRGDRFVSQTLNPKTNIWNNPKKSTYVAVAVLRKEKATGYIHWVGLYWTTGREEIINFEKKLNGIELSDKQKEQIRIVKSYSKAYENVTFTFETKKFRHKVTGEITEQVPLFDMSSYEEVGNENGERDKKREQDKKDIQKMVAYHYVKQDF